MNKQPKPKKCKACKKEFTPKYTTTQRVCSLECSIEYAQAQEKKKANIRARNKRKDYPETYYKENKAQLQKLVQQIARLIDINAGCIDCDRKQAHRWDGGHFVSKGANGAIALNLHNIFNQNGWCNNQGNTSKEKFLEGIINTYGEKYGAYTDDLSTLYPYLGLKAHQYPELIIEALKIVREIKKENELIKTPRKPKERIELRDKYNKRLGIYLKGFKKD